MSRPSNPDLVARLLRIAATLIEERGSGSVTLAEVARRADITSTTVHYYFRSRAGLLEQAREVATLDLGVSCARAAAQQQSAPEQLREFARAFFEWSKTYPRTFSFIFEPISWDSMNETMRRPYRASFDLLQRIFTQGMQRGELAAADSHVQASMLFAALFGISYLRLTGHLTQANQIVEETVASILGELAPPAHAE